MAVGQYDFWDSQDILTRSEPITGSGTATYPASELHAIKGFGKTLIEMARLRSPFTQLRGSLDSLDAFDGAAPAICNSTALKEGGRTFRLAYEHPNEDDPYILDQDMHGLEFKDEFTHQDFSVTGWRKTRMTSPWEQQLTLIDLMGACEKNCIRDHNRIDDEMDISCMLGVDLLDYAASLKIFTGAYAKNQLVCGGHSNVGQLNSDDYLTTEAVNIAAAMGEAGEMDDSNEINYSRDVLVNGRAYRGVVITDVYGAYQIAHFDPEFRDVMKNAAPRSGDNLMIAGLGFQFEYFGVLYMILGKNLGRLLRFTTAGYKSARFNATNGAATQIVDKSGTGYTPSTAGGTSIFLSGLAMATFDGKYEYPFILEPNYDGIFKRYHNMNIAGLGLIDAACKRAASALTTTSQNLVLIHHAGGSPNV